MSGLDDLRDGCANRFIQGWAAKTIEQLQAENKRLTNLAIQNRWIELKQSPPPQEKTDV